MSPALLATLAAGAQIGGAEMARSANVQTDAVKIGKRHRKDMGDLKPLAQSIETEGLLQPIGVTKDLELVFGQRRLLAVRDVLGWDRIEAKVVDVSSIAAGEYAENEIRKDFTLSERDAIRQTLEAKIGDRRVAPANGADVANCPHATRTRDITTEQAGFENVTEARRVREVTTKGTPALVKAMDEGTLPVSVAAKTAELPKPKQNKIAKAENPKAAAKAAAKEALKRPKPNWAKGPTPKEEAENDPGRRWHSSLHKLYVFMTSTRDLGGIAKLTKKWAQESKKEYVAELKRIVGELNKWITILEDKG